VGGFDHHQDGHDEQRETDEIVDDAHLEAP
jgi:hypothetical protein